MTKTLMAIIVVCMFLESCEQPKRRHKTTDPHTHQLGTVEKKLLGTWVLIKRIDTFDVDHNGQWKISVQDNFSGSSFVKFTSVPDSETADAFECIDAISSQHACQYDWFYQPEPKCILIHSRYYYIMSMTDQEMELYLPKIPGWSFPSRRLYLHKYI